MFMNVATIDITMSEDSNKSGLPKYNNGYSNPVFTEDLSPDAEPVKSNSIIADTKVTISDFNINDTKDYDPHDFSNSSKPTSYCDTLLHLLKAAIGTGILTIPSAFKEAGYGVGIIGVVIITIFYAYCVHMLLDAEYELCRRRRQINLTYAGTVEAAFEEGPKKLRWLAGVGKFSANFFFMIYECGGCAIYIIFICENLKQLLDYYMEDDIPLRLLMAYVTIPLILCCWIRNLKLLAPLSALANFMIIVSFILVFWYVFQEVPSFEDLHATGEVSKIPLYLTTILFSVASTGLIFPLKNEMKKSKYFSTAFGVLNVSMIPLTLLYTSFGFFGYLKYGNNIESSITLNLPKTEFLAQLIKGLYSLSIFISYHLCYYVVFDIVWKNYLQNKVKSNCLFWEYVIRSLIPIITFLMAYAIPNLNLFISLVGALGISTTSLVIPIIIHSLVFYDRHTTNKKRFIYFLKNGILLSVAIMIFITGLIDSVSDIIKAYYK